MDKFNYSSIQMMDCDKIKVIITYADMSCEVNGKMDATYEYQSTIEDDALKKVGMELMFLTPEKMTHTEGITAVELAKLLDIPTEIVKQKLKILYDKDIVRVIGINPKLWKFDEYNFQRMDEDDEVYRLLCCFDDVDFDRYFNY